MTYYRMRLFVGCLSVVCVVNCTPGRDNGDAIAVNPQQCGNHIVEPSETCDPPSSCPTSCNDGNVCTVDQLTGSSANCNVACSHTSITTCTSGDGCCPAGCNANTDSDCSPTCGNGVVEPGETCDPASSCPTSCNDGNVCTVDQLTGSSANCNVACSHTSITTCTSGDGCCPAGCNANTDSDCSPTCGNGVVEPGETCDPPATCRTSCDDDSTCTMDQMTGNADNCNVACSHTVVATQGTPCNAGPCRSAGSCMYDGVCHNASYRICIFGPPDACHIATVVCMSDGCEYWAPAPDGTPCGLNRICGGGNCVASVPPS